MEFVRRYSVVLLLVGVGLIAGSCVPLAQTVWSSRDAPPVKRLAISPDGDASTGLVIAERQVSVPVVLVRLYPGATDADSGGFGFTFSIADASGRDLLRESGTAGLGRARPESAGLAEDTVELRFPRLRIPSGQWQVRLNTRDAGLVRGAELRLLPAGPGLIPALLTTLVLAILGWLTASLGALQWIRAEAADPARGTDAIESDRNQRERLWTVGCHLSALLGYLLPFAHVLGPLVIWLAKRHDYPDVEQAGREALNFQLSATLYVLAGLLLTFFLIGLVVLFVVVVFHFSMVLYVSLRAQRGLDVRYPFCIRFI